MASKQYFEFLGTVWDQLPKKDRELLAETWQGYEQIFAAIYQRFVETNINLSIKDLLPYNTERWLPYVFNNDNVINEKTTLISSQDLALGLNLTNKYLLKLSVDNGVPIEIDIRGINPGNTKIQEINSKINAAFGFAFSSMIFEETVIKLTSRLTGALSSIIIHETSDPSKNACEFVLGVSVLDLPAVYPLYPYLYKLPYPRVASIPSFRNSIRDESLEIGLTEGIDYTVSEGQYISFKSIPPQKMWAKRTLFDEETPFNNFGFLMDIFQPTSKRYVEVLKGLWFAFWTGPKPSNVRTSLYLLFGLPVARFNGVVTNLTTTSITVRYDNNETDDFQIPSGLVALVSLGQSFVKFDPLVNGIEVYDKINRPGFIADEIGREGISRFLTEEATRGPGEDTDETRALRLLEEYTFLPQISVDAFISPDINLGNVKIFLDAIKPLNKTYLFQVIVGSFRDSVDFDDSYSYYLDINVTPTIDSNETTYQSSGILLDYETIDNEGLNLDPEVLLFQESIAVEVRQGLTLIDNFVV